MLLKGFVIALMLAPTIALAGLGKPYAPERMHQQNPESGNPHLLLAKKWDELSDDERKRIKDAKERYQKLPPEKKEQLRNKWENMSPKEKEKYRLERQNQQR